MCFLFEKLTNIFTTTDNYHPLPESFSVVTCIRFGSIEVVYIKNFDKRGTKRCVDIVLLVAVSVSTIFSFNNLFVDV
ncbi:hypothetical protein B4U80_03581 [Leptotrombidium deliense]|uniref:Uncharacterized protein n=1 Tax=Leptotrombidium deliense TaxID=299467 RepID=A0A443SEC1_9ACAR|nr:hypothetical protein B4U80_03581 [Leptotrombidium deliense]